MREPFRLAALILLIVLVILTLYAGIYFITRYRALPEPAVMNQAENIIRSKAQPDDRLATNPRWAYYFVLAGVRYDKGGRFNWIDGIDDGNWDCALDTDIERLWLVSLFGEGIPSQLESIGFTPFHREELERLEVIGLKREKPRQVLNLMKNIPKARVWTQDRNGTVTNAQLQNNSMVFPGAPGWSRIKISVENIGGEIHRCIFTHPQQDKTIKLQFSMPPWAEKLHLDGGLLLNAAWHKDPGLLTMAAVNGTQKIAEMNFQHVSRWEHQIVDIEDASKPLTIEISADKIGGRHFCWRGYVLGE